MSAIAQRVKVSDLRPKEEVQSTFLVKYLNLCEARDGKKYLNIILADDTGDMEARIWNGAEELSESIEKGAYVSVKGKANIYMGKKQFIVTECSPIDSSEVNEDEFIAKAQSNPETMFEELVGIVKSLPEVYIRDLLLNVLGDNEVERRLKTWQAGKSIHHAYQSGLLEHILSCARLSQSLSAHYKVNESYVVAGAILHDLCKIYELTDGANVEYTEEGKLVGHLVKGVELVDKYSYRTKGFPHHVKLHLKHVLLSHHGHYEFGSPKIPQTSEAMLLHLIDMMDSKMHSFETIKRNDPNTGRWSGYVKHLDRIIYKEELPSYHSYLETEDRDSKGEAGQTRPNHRPNHRPKNGHKSRPKSERPYEKEVKQNLGSLLKDFKVDK